MNKREKPNNVQVSAPPVVGSAPQTQAKSLTHILSVDVEDYFQVEAFADSIPRDSWGYWPSRVVANTHRVLDLFDRHGAKATFFFVGWVAERFPSLVREVAERGHELGCHSFWHRPIYSLTPNEFRADTRLAKAVIQDAGGLPVHGYRAPTWSITRDCLWALDVLAEAGFLYDSSIYPIRHDLYGVPSARRFPYSHSCADGLSLREFPPATLRIAGFNLPAAGGGYLRLFPLFYTRWTFHSFEKKYRQPVVVYFHPWELDPDQPRLKGSLRSRFRHYTNLCGLEARLARLLASYAFQPFREALTGDKSASANAVPEAATRLSAAVSRYDGTE